ncbi:MAG: TatD family hydrolase [Coriobacteriia bacterium]|nr:TatD family hydrolase [Coriobacteriia bacterium]
MSVLAITNKKGQPVELPAFAPASLIDTHTHLGMQADPSLRIARAAVAGLGTLITICDPGELLEPEGEHTDEVALTYDTVDCWRAQAREILDAEGRSDLPTPEVRTLIGLHPHHARFWSPDIEAQIRERAGDTHTVGLGEMGLDYHYDYSPRDVQRKVFAAELRLARELDLPVCLHLREAHDDGLRILREVGVPSRGAVLHCFNLDYEVAAPFVELGCVVSFAGPLTFKKAEEVREAARLAPQGRIMVETDAPFMAPEPLRGTVCEPAFTAFTAARLAEVRDVSLDEIAAQTTACAREVYRL